MSVVKSYSFPAGDIRGDMFYINHDTDNFTIIDCYLKEGDDASCRREEILDEIKGLREQKTINRFISTHPHNDHFLGIEAIDAQSEIINFYAVANEHPANADDVSLTKYIELRDNKNYPIVRGLKRNWINGEDAVRKSSGIHFLWPDVNNKEFIEALKKVKEGTNQNDISCVFLYLVGSARYMWMGDMETNMQNVFFQSEKDNIRKVDVLFHPHHGRKSSAPSKELMDALDPKIIVIGNAPANDLNYDDPDRTITQNRAGDVVFVNVGNAIHIYTQNVYENSPKCLVKVEGRGYNKLYGFYLGTLYLD